MIKIGNWQLVTGNLEQVKARLKLHSQESERGFIVPTIVIIMVILTVSALALADFSISRLSRLNTNYFATNSLLSAEAGAEQTLYRLNQDNNFTGYGSEQQFFSNNTQGRATYQTTVTAGGVSNEKIITSTGRIFRHSSDTQPLVTRKVRLLVVGTSTSDSYAVQAGTGGLTLTGSATIANGPVYINGGISMSGAARIGSASVPVDVSVANFRCPLSAPYTTYPSLCSASSGQPIGANIYSNRIYGDVCATHQTTGSYMSNSGLIAGCQAPFLPLPDHNRTAVTGNISSNQTAAQASCGGATSKSWPANLKITGNVTISGSCSLTINGNVWVTGSLTIDGAARVIVANSASVAPTLMVDGASGIVLGGSGRIIPNTNNIAALGVTYRSAGACSPDCASVSGADLKNSEATTTVSISGAAQAPGTLFYARWSRAVIAGSGSTGGVMGQRIDISGAGNVVFGTKLSSGTSVWSIKNYQQIFD